MKIDFTTPIKDLDGEVIKDGEGDKAKPVTLSKLATNALLQRYKGEEDLSGEESFARFMLAKKITDGPLPVDLSAEEVSLIKRLIAKLYAPAIVGPAYLILEGKNDG